MRIQIAPSLHRRNNNPAQNNFLTRQKDNQSWYGRKHQCSQNHRRFRGYCLLELVDPNHQHPHILILAHEKRPHKSAVSRQKLSQGNNGEDRFAKGNRNPQKNRQFAGAVNGECFVDLVGQTPRGFTVRVPRMGKKTRTTALNGVQPLVIIN
ncbi:hypothetical protein JXJ21_00945 [candidate division KSB1 bacterium]|nr:hypothetical protein [candidate division KSB1 bacterium]